MDPHKIALQVSHEAAVDPVLAQEKRDLYIAAAAEEETSRHAPREFGVECNRLRVNYLQKKTASDADPSNPALAAATAEADHLSRVADAAEDRIVLDYQIKYTSMCRALLEYKFASCNEHGISYVLVPLYKECTSHSCLCPRTSNGELSCIHYSSDE
jgi:hypothetical protein